MAGAAKSLGFRTNHALHVGNVRIQSHLDDTRRVGQVPPCRTGWFREAKFSSLRVGSLGFGSGCRKEHMTSA